MSDQATITIFNAETGLIAGVMSVPRSQIAVNVPDGCDYIEGAHDGGALRVNPSTRAVEDYTPPPPPAAAARYRRNAPIRLRIVALESQQPRAVREAILTGNKAALQQIEAQIEVLRNTLERD
jgi:hypothetical protein